jgi:hypothetical protein
MFALLFLFVANASPMTASQRLDHAQAMIDALDYAEAADEAGFVISDPSASQAERLKANIIAGSANRIIGRDTDARLNFRYVLATDPAFSLPPSTPPKVLNYFELVRQELRSEQRQREVERPTKPSSSVVVGEDAPSMVPIIMAGAGLAIALGGAGVATWAELAVQQPKPFVEREPDLLVGRVGLATAALGVVILAVGGGWAVLSP